MDLLFLRTNLITEAIIMIAKSETIDLRVVVIAIVAAFLLAGTGVVWQLF